MKKLLFIALLVGVIYKGFTALSQKNAGAFDDQGNAQVLLFTVSRCGAPCSDAKKLLEKRKVNFEEVVASNGKEEEKRLRQYTSSNYMPLMVIGDEKTIGYNKWNYISALAVGFQEKYLTRSEARILGKNFTSDGQPKLVMYTMDGCGYCKRAIDQLNKDGIAFEERNTSRDSKAKGELNKLESGTPLIYYGYRRFDGWSSKVYADLKKVL